MPVRSLFLRVVSAPVRWTVSAISSSLLTMLTVAVVLGAFAVTAPPGSAQVAATPPASGGTGINRGSLVLAIESPATDQQLHTDRDFLIVGYALDKNANMNQGVQSSGIDRVQLFMVGPTNTPMADAELGFSDANAASFGSQFANSGFRLSFHPGDFPPGSHNLYVVAHSVVNGQQLEMLYWISITTEPTGGRGQASTDPPSGGAAGGGGGAPAILTSSPVTASTGAAAATATPTASRSSGGTSTAVSTPTSSPSPRGIAATAQTPPATATQTATPTLTAAPTMTPTVTPTSALTPTLTATQTLTPTLTPTPTVTPISQPPTISAVAEQFMDANTTKLVSFTVGDPDTPLSSLQVRATSDAQQIVPDAALVVSAIGVTRMLSITPLPDTSGTIKITITVSDPTGLSASTSFMLTIT